MPGESGEGGGLPPINRKPSIQTTPPPVDNGVTRPAEPPAAPDPFQSRIEQEASSISGKISAVKKRVWESPSATLIDDIPLHEPLTPDPEDPSRQTAIDLMEIVGRYKNVRKDLLGDVLARKKNISGMADFMEHIPDHRKLAAFAEVFEPLMEDVSELGPRLTSGYMNSVYQEVAGARIYTPDEALQRFVTRVRSASRWREEYLGRDDIREDYTPEQIGEANGIFVRELEREVVGRVVTDYEMDLEQQREFFELATPETMPGVLLMAYRQQEDFNDPNKKSWIHMDAGTKPQETPLYKAVARLTDEDLDALSQKQIPGLVEAIRLIRDHPDSYRNPKIALDTNAEEQRGVHAQIEHNVVQMAAHFLENNNHRYMIAALQALQGFDNVSGALPAVDKVMAEHNNGGYLYPASILLDKAAATDPAASRIIVKRFSKVSSALRGGGEWEKVVKGSLRPFVNGEPLDEHFAWEEGLLLRHPQENRKLRADEVIQTVEFLRDLRDLGHSYDETTVPKFLDYVQPAHARETLLPFLRELHSTGYVFNVDHYEAFGRMGEEHRTAILTMLKLVKKYVPDFAYEPVPQKLLGQTNMDKTYYLVSPLEIFAHNTDTPTMIRQMHAMQTEHDLVPRLLTDTLYHKTLKGNAYILQAQYEHVPEDTLQVFQSQISELANQLHDSNSPLFAAKDLLANDHIVRMVATHPETGVATLRKIVEEVPEIFKALKNEKGLGVFSEDITRTITTAEDPVQKAKSIYRIAHELPSFFPLLTEGGPLYTNRHLIFERVFENGNPLQHAQEILTVFTKKIPYWKQLFLYTDTRLGKDLANAATEYPITVLPKIRVEKGTKLEAKETADKGVIRDFDITQDFSFRPTPIADLSVAEKRSIAAIGSLSDAEVADLREIPFNKLLPIYKKTVFAYYLDEGIQTSRDAGEKEQADQRNRQNTLEEMTSLQENNYLHGATSDVLPLILLNGNLPGESLGETAASDSFPFQVDFTNVTYDHLSRHHTLRSQLLQSLSGEYPKDSTVRETKGIFLVYDRHETSWEEGISYGPPNRPNQALVLGNMPATEISKIIIRSPQEALEGVKASVIENGFYIPLYDLDGKLLFTADEYDALRKNHNYAVPVETWDYSLKTGEQRGGNPGAEFTVPSEAGPERYYVKFLHEGASADHLWNEQLADAIYRHSGIPVPETKIVRIEGTYGHASKMIDQATEGVEISDQPTWNNGFLVDALLANWDIATAPERNCLVDQAGSVVRLDNGGALLFHALGARRDFGTVVSELQTLRYHYPELSQEQLTVQALRLRETLTDGAISDLVDSVRLPEADRLNLKQTLAARRDFVLREVLGDEIATRHIPETGRKLQTLLEFETVEDAQISELTPEWKHLTGETGYQHDNVLLGTHIKDALRFLRITPEFSRLSPDEQHIATIATFFHDFGKPTGGIDEKVQRDFNHEIPSAQKAAEYMQSWGYDADTIGTVLKVISYDGIVSDIARDKVRDPEKQFTPQQLQPLLSPEAIRILRAVNRADVIATVGSGGWNNIEQEYNQFFDEMENN